MAFQGLASPLASSPSSILILKVRTKPGKTAQHGYDPGSFQTQRGRLLVPRQINPPQPSPEEISEARRGRLTGCFEDGRIYRASDFVGDVAQHTAKMSLDDTYEYETRLLSAFIFVPEDQKSLRNLFFIAVKQGELPSYHFWTRPQDPEPVIKGKPTDWDEILQNSKPAGWEEMTGQSNYQLGSSRRPSHEDKNNHQKTQSPTSQEQPTEAPLEQDPSHRSDGHEQRTTSGKERATAPASLTQNTFPSSINSSGLNTATRGDSQISPKGTVHRAAANQESGLRRASQYLPDFFPSLSSPSQTSGIPLLGDAHLRSNNLPDVATKPSQDEPRESSVLLRSDRGGIYLHDFSKAAFKETMLHMIKHEENDTDPFSALRFLDILKPGNTTSEVVSLPGKGIDFDRVFRRKVQPYLGLRGYNFRIRSDAYRERAPWDNGKKDSLKITRVGVGYCYVNPDGSWSDPQNLYSNSARLEDALKYLFDQESREDDPPLPDSLTLEIPLSHESFDLDLLSSPIVPSEVGEILDEISQTPVSSGPFEPIQYTYAAEVFIHKTGVEFVHPLVLAAQAMGPQEDEAGEDKEEEPQAEDEGLPMQQEARQPEVTEDIPQQPERRQWSMAPPQTTFEYNPGAVAPSNRPKVRTQSEIGDMERRLKIAEERVAELSRANLERERLETVVGGQEQQIGYLARENGELEGRAITAEKQVADFERQRSQLRIQQRDLESEVRGLKAERDQLKQKVAGLNDELVQDRVDRTLLRSTLENVESQVVALTDERDQLQSRVEAAESGTSGQDQRKESTGDNAPGPAPDQSENVSGEPAAGLSASDDRPTDVLPPPDTTVPTADPPSGSADPKRLLYCASCMKSVDKLDDNGKAKHAEKCSVTVSSFIYLTIQEAKEMRKAASAPSAKDKGKGRAVSTDEAGPSAQADQPTEDTSTSAKADTDRKRKRAAKDEGKPDEPVELSRTRPKRNAKKPVKDPQESAPPPTKKVKTKETRTRTKSAAPPPETIEPDGDSSAGELGPVLKRKTKDSDDLPGLKPTTTRARGQASAPAPEPEITEPDGDSSAAETGARRKRKAKDEVEPPTRVSTRKKSKR